MKKYIALLLVLTISSCAKPRYKSAEAVSDVFEESEEATFEVLKDSYNLLITEKLQDYLDTKSLAKEHPNFKDTYNNIDLELFIDKSAKEIRNIQFIGQPKIISDSITKLTTQVHFANASIDTIVSYIKTSTTMIDGIKFKTSKASFEKTKPSTKD